MSWTKLLAPALYGGKASRCVHEEEIMANVVELPEFKMSEHLAHTVLLCAQFNRLSYQATESGVEITNLRSELMVLRLFEECKDLSVPWLIAQEQDDACGQRLFISFRGSMSKANWIGNFTFKPRPIMENTGVHGHEYVLRQARIIAKQLSLWLQQEAGNELVSKVKHVILTGHSLGGAVALMMRSLVVEWADALSNDVEFEVVTFGAPPAIAAPALEGQDPDVALQMLLGEMDRIIQFVHMHDVVPKVFRTAMNAHPLLNRLGQSMGVKDFYFHPGNVVVIGKLITPKIIPAGDTFASHHAIQRDILKSGCLDEDVWSYHNMATYIQHIFQVDS